MNEDFAELVARERIRQIAQWGGSLHDDQHTIDDWTLFIRKQADLANEKNAVERLVKIAALADAAYCSLVRKELSKP